MMPGGTVGEMQRDLHHFKADPNSDKAFYFNADPDPDPNPWRQTNADADPDPGQTSKSRKVAFLHEKYTYSR
jgi:hypothetical protein